MIIIVLRVELWNFTVGEWQHWRLCHSKCLDLGLVVLTFHAGVLCKSRLCCVGPRLLNRLGSCEHRRQWCRWRFRFGRHFNALSDLKGSLSACSLVWVVQLMLINCGVVSEMMKKIVGIKLTVSNLTCAPQPKQQTSQKHFLLLFPLRCLTSFVQK